MIEIKAFVHRGRVADIVHALDLARFDQVSIVDTLSLPGDTTFNDEQFSVDTGARVVPETKIEVYCPKDRLEQVVEILRENAQTGDESSGWIFVSDIVKAIPLVKE